MHKGLPLPKSAMFDTTALIPALGARMRCAAGICFISSASAETTRTNTGNWGRGPAAC
jgi:hypothetical protein